MEHIGCSIQSVAAKLESSLVPVLKIPFENLLALRPQSFGRNSAPRVTDADGPNPTFWMFGKRHQAPPR